VLKGEALGVFEPAMRKKASCWDSQLKMLESGPMRFVSPLDESDCRMVMITPIAALVTMFALARKSFVSFTGNIVAHAGTADSFANARRPSRVALWTSSWAAICMVTLAIDFPSAEASVKVASLLRLLSAPAKKPDSMPSIKFATLKFVRALALNEVCGGGPPGTPPPACWAVPGASRTGADCDEAVAAGIIDADEPVALETVDNDIGGCDAAAGCIDEFIVAGNVLVEVLAAGTGIVEVMAFINGLVDTAAAFSSMLSPRRNGAE